jgi:hypothetical protein
MNGSIPPLPQYASIAWCFVKAQGQLYLYLYLYLLFIFVILVKLSLLKFTFLVYFVSVFHGFSGSLAPSFIETQLNVLYGEYVIVCNICKCILYCTL